MDQIEIANAIEVRGLTKIYRAIGKTAEKTALDGIDLDVPKGSIFGLLGPNGAGKSTFINILAGLTVKTSGTVRIWGFDQDVNPRQSRAAIGVVPQELNVDPFFSPIRALEVQAGLYAVPKAERRSQEILDRLGLGDKANAYARTLSGGMRRRLLVAKAMVHTPAVLVLDEPTAGVDLELRRMLWDYVRELNDLGTTVILTTHYLEEAEEMCDRIAIVNHGEVVACDETSRLLERFDTKTLVVRFDRPVADQSALAAELGDKVSVVRRADDTFALGYPRRSLGPRDLIARVEAAGYQINDLTTEEPHLEHVFLALTSSTAPRPLAAQ